MEYYKTLDLQDIIYFCEFDLIWKIEEWRDVPNYEGIYQVSDLGRVKSLVRFVNKFKGARTVKESILKNSSDNKGYLSITLYSPNKRKTIKVHQVVSIAFLNHKICGMELVVNHKNFNKLDNRKLNLEIITARENSNRKHLKSSSNFTGVYWETINGKWKSQIVINGKRKHLGRFYNEIDAHNAYQNALKNLT